MKRIPCMEAVVAVLESEGVDTVFGIPGAAILPLYAALQHSDIRNITVRHEEEARTPPTAGPGSRATSASASAPRARRAPT